MQRYLIRYRNWWETYSKAFGISLRQLLGRARIKWHGTDLYLPDWSHDSHSIAVTLWSLDERFMFHMIFNAYCEPLEFRLPPVGDRLACVWRRWMDTSLEPPYDITSLKDFKIMRGDSYLVQSHSVVALVARQPRSSVLRSLEKSRE